MPAYGAAKYDSGALKALAFTPGIRTVLFGTLTAQAKNWAGAQGEPVFPVVAEEISVDAASQQVVFHRNEHFPQAVGLELQFSADPGAFQIDIQTADTDKEEAYVTKVSISEGLNAGFYGRTELHNVVAKFLRLKLVARANAVNLLATVS